MWLGRSDGGAPPHTETVCHWAMKIGIWNYEIGVMEKATSESQAWQRLNGLWKVHTDMTEVCVALKRP